MKRRYLALFMAMVTTCSQILGTSSFVMAEEAVIEHVHDEVADEELELLSEEWSDDEIMELSIDDSSEILLPSVDEAEVILDADAELPPSEEGSEELTILDVEVIEPEEVPENEFETESEMSTEVQSEYAAELETEVQSEYPTESETEIQSEDMTESETETTEIPMQMIDLEVGMEAEVLLSGIEEVDTAEVEAMFLNEGEADGEEGGEEPDEQPEGLFDNMQKFQDFRVWDNTNVIYTGECWEVKLTNEVVDVITMQFGENWVIDWYVGHPIETTDGTFYEPETNQIGFVQDERIVSELYDTQMTSVPLQGIDAAEGMAVWAMLHEVVVEEGADGAPKNTCQFVDCFYVEVEVWDLYEEYRFNYDTNWQALRYDTYDIGNGLEYYKQYFDTNRNEVVDVKGFVSVTDVYVDSEKTADMTVKDENGAETETDILWVENKTDGSGWRVHADGPGQGQFAVTYSLYGSETEVVRYINVDVIDDMWGIDYCSETGTHDLLPGSSLVLATNTWRRCYSDDEGHFDGEVNVEMEYVLADENCEGIISLNPVEGENTRCTVKADVQPNQKVEVIIRAYLLDENGNRVQGNSNEAICVAETSCWINITNADGYYNLELVSKDEADNSYYHTNWEGENLLPGETERLRPEVRMYYLNTENQEQVVSMDNVYYDWHYDDTVVSIEPVELTVQTGIGDDDTPITETVTGYNITKLQNCETDITLIARWADGNEIVRRSWHLNSQNYDVWFDNLRGDGHSWFFTNEDHEILLNVNNIINIDEDGNPYIKNNAIEIDWRIGIMDGDNFTDLNEISDEVTGIYEAKQNSFSAVIHGAKFAELGMEEGTWIEVQAIVTVNEMQMDFESIGFELCDPVYDYYSNMPEHWILPGNYISINKNDTMICRYTDGTAPHGDEKHVAITDISVVSDHTDDMTIIDEDGKEATVDILNVQPWYNDENELAGWNVNVDGLGDGQIAVTYELCDGDATVTAALYTMQIHAVGSMWGIDYWSETGTYNLLPGDSLVLGTDVWRRCYTEENGHFDEEVNVEMEYVLANDSYGEIVELKPVGNDQTKCEVISKNIPDRRVEIIIRAYELDNENQRIQYDDQSFEMRETSCWIDVTDANGYYNLELIHDDGQGNNYYDINWSGVNLIPGESALLKPEVRLYSQSENSPSPLETGFVYEWEYDDKAVSIELYTGSDDETDNEGIPVLTGESDTGTAYKITKLKNQDTDITLIARWADGNEIVRRSWHLNSQNYDVWFDNLRGDGHSWFFTNEDHEILLNVNNIINIDADGNPYIKNDAIEIDWRIGIMEGDNFTDLNEISNGSYEAEKNSFSAVIHGAEFAELNMEEGTWIEVQASVTVNGMQMDFESIGLELRDPSYEYERPQAEYWMLPGEQFGINDMIKCRYTDASAIEGDESYLPITNISCECEDGSVSVVEWEDKNGWEIFAHQSGSAQITLTYDLMKDDPNYDQNTPATYIFNVNVHDAEHRVYFSTNTAADRVLPGKRVKLTAELVLECYNPEKGNFRGNTDNVEYTWEYSSETDWTKNFSIIEEDPVRREDGTIINTFAVKAKTRAKTGDFVDITIRGFEINDEGTRVKDGEGKDICLVEGTFRVTVEETYIKIDPVSLPNERQPIGVPMEFHPTLVEYKDRNTVGFELEDARYRWEWDETAVEIATVVNEEKQVLTQKADGANYGDGPYYITRLKNQNARICLIAELPDENNNYGEVARQDWWFHETDYAYDFHELLDEGHSWIYTDQEETTLSLHVNDQVWDSNVVSVEWQLAMHDENGSIIKNADEAQVPIYQVNEDGRSIRIDVQNAISYFGGTGTWFDVEAYISVNEVEVDHVGMNYEIRDSRFESDFPGDHAWLPERSVEIREEYRILVENEEFPHGKEMTVFVQDVGVEEDDPDNPAFGEIEEWEDEDGNRGWSIPTITGGAATICIGYEREDGPYAEYFFRAHVGHDLYSMQIESNTGSNNVLPGGTLELNASVWYDYFHYDEYGNVDCKEALDVTSDMDIEWEVVPDDSGIVTQSGADSNDPTSFSLTVSDNAEEEAFVQVKACAYRKVDDATSQISDETGTDNPGTDDTDDGNQGEGNPGEGTQGPEREPIAELSYDIHIHGEYYAVELEVIPKNTSVTDPRYIEPGEIVTIIPHVYKYGYYETTDENGEPVVSNRMEVTSNVRYSFCWDEKAVAFYNSEFNADDPESNKMEYAHDDWSDYLVDSSDSDDVSVQMLKEENWNTGIRVSAELCDEKGNWNEVGQPEYNLYAHYYDMWFTDLRKPEDHFTWLFDDEEVYNISIQTQNLTENCEVVWEVGYPDGEEFVDVNELYIPMATGLDPALVYSAEIDKEDTSKQTLHIDVSKLAAVGVTPEKGYDVQIHAYVLVNGIEVNHISTGLGVWEAEYTFVPIEEGIGFTTNQTYVISDEKELVYFYFRNADESEGKEVPVRITEAALKDDCSGVVELDEESWELSATEAGHAILSLKCEPITYEDGPDLSAYTGEIDVDVWTIQDVIKVYPVTGTDNLLPGASMDLEVYAYRLRMDEQGNIYQSDDLGGVSLGCRPADETHESLQYFTIEGIEDKAESDNWGCYKRYTVTAKETAENNEAIRFYMYYEEEDDAGNNQRYELTSTDYTVYIKNGYTNLEPAYLDNHDLAYGESTVVTPELMQYLTGKTPEAYEGVSYTWEWDPEVVSVEYMTNPGTEDETWAPLCMHNECEEPTECENPDFITDGTFRITKLLNEESAIKLTASYGDSITEERTWYLNWISYFNYPGYPEEQLRGDGWSWIYTEEETAVVTANLNPYIYGVEDAELRWHLWDMKSFDGDGEDAEPIFAQDSCYTVSDDGKTITINIPEAIEAMELNQGDRFEAAVDLFVDFDLTDEVGGEWVEGHSAEFEIRELPYDYPGSEPGSESFLKEDGLRIDSSMKAWVKTSEDHEDEYDVTIDEAKVTRTAAWEQQDDGEWIAVPTKEKFAKVTRSNDDNCWYLETSEHGEIDVTITYESPLTGETQTKVLTFYAEGETYHLEWLYPYNTAQMLPYDEIHIGSKLYKEWKNEHGHTDGEELDDYELRIVRDENGPAFNTDLINAWEEGNEIVVQSHGESGGTAIQVEIIRWDEDGREYCQGVRNLYIEVTEEHYSMEFEAVNEADGEVPMVLIGEEFDLNELLPTLYLHQFGTENKIDAKAECNVKFEIYDMGEGWKVSKDEPINPDETINAIEETDPDDGSNPDDVTGPSVSEDELPTLIRIGSEDAWVDIAAYIEGEDGKWEEVFRKGIDFGNLEYDVQVSWNYQSTDFGEGLKVFTVPDDEKKKDTPLILTVDGVNLRGDNQTVLEDYEVEWILTPHDWCDKDCISGVVSNVDNSNQYTLYGNAERDGQWADVTAIINYQGGYVGQFDTAVNVHVEELNYDLPEFWHMLPYWNDGFDMWNRGYIRNADIPNGEEFDYQITKIEVKDEKAFDSNPADVLRYNEYAYGSEGIEEELYGTVRPNKHGWYNLEAFEHGTATVELTIERNIGGISSTDSHSFSVTVTDDRYELGGNYSNQNEDMIYGQTMTIDTSLWKWEYILDEGRHVEDFYEAYTLEFDTENPWDEDLIDVEIFVDSTNEENPDNGKVIQVTANDEEYEGETYINVWAVVNENPVAYQSFRVYVSGAYTNILPETLPEELAMLPLGGSLAFEDMGLEVYRYQKPEQTDEPEDSVEPESTEAPEDIGEPEVVNEPEGTDNSVAEGEQESTENSESSEEPTTPDNAENLTDSVNFRWKDFDSNAWDFDEENQTLIRKGDWDTEVEIGAYDSKGHEIASRRYHINGLWYDVDIDYEYGSREHSVVYTNEPLTLSLTGKEIPEDVDYHVEWEFHQYNEHGEYEADCVTWRDHKNGSVTVEADDDGYAGENVHVIAKLVYYAENETKVLGETETHIEVMNPVYCISDMHEYMDFIVSESLHFQYDASQNVYPVNVYAQDALNPFGKEYQAVITEIRVGDEELWELTYDEDQNATLKAIGGGNAELFFQIKLSDEYAEDSLAAGIPEEIRIGTGARHDAYYLNVWTEGSHADGEVLVGDGLDICTELHYVQYQYSENPETKEGSEEIIDTVVHPSEYSVEYHVDDDNMITVNSEGHITTNENRGETWITVVAWDAEEVNEQGEPIYFTEERFRINVTGAYYAVEAKETLYFSHDAEEEKEFDLTTKYYALSNDGDGVEVEDTLTYIAAQWNRDYLHAEGFAVIPTGKAYELSKEDDPYETSVYIEAMDTEGNVIGGGNVRVIICNHDATEKILETATCQEAGTKQFICKKEACKQVWEEEYENPNAHTAIAQWTEIVKATCTTDGMKVKYCTYGCTDAEGNQVIVESNIQKADGTSHVASSEWKTTVEPTCTTAGTQVKYCTYGCTDAQGNKVIVESGILEADGTSHVASSTWKTTQESTCKTPGTRVQYCKESGCGEIAVSEALALNPAAHVASGEWVTTEDSTCKTPGTRVQYCKESGCGEIAVSEVLALNPAAHVASGEWVTTEDSTCKTPGTRVQYCKESGCGEIAVSEALALNPAAHVASGTWKTTQESTCKTRGTRVQYCTETGCGQIAKSETLALSNHVADTVWTITQEPTCTATGTKVQKCKYGCGTAVNTETIKAIGHTAGSWTVTKKATCTAAGEQVQKCTVCGTAVNKQPVTATGHKLSDWTVTTTATCTEDGVKMQLCTNVGCDHSVTEMIPATGHKLGDWKETDDSTKSVPEEIRTCQNAGCDENEIRTMKLAATSLKLKKNQSTKVFKITEMAEGDSVVSVKSSKSSIFKVQKFTAGGAVTLKAAKSKTGSAYLTVTLKSGLERKIKVTVQKGKVTTKSVKLESKKITMKRNAKITLIPILNPITTQDKVTFKSKNKSIATVNSKGVVTAKKKGKTTITVQSGKKKATCTITVK